MPQSLIFIKRGQTVRTVNIYYVTINKGQGNNLVSESNSEAQQRFGICKDFFVRNFSAPYRAVWKFRVARCHLWIPSAALEVHQGPVGPLEVQHLSRIAPWASESTQEILQGTWNAWKEFAWQLENPQLAFWSFCLLCNFYALQVECTRTQPLTAPRTPPLPSTKFPSKPSVKKASWWLVQAESQNGSKVNATRISTNSTIKIYIDYLIFVYWFDNIISNATGPPHNQADVKSKVARKSHLPGSEVNWNGG